jgi:MFS family permease
MTTPSLTRRPMVHYAWVVAAVTFVVLLVAAGVRAAPGALIKPLEAEFGWDRASISLAVAVSILTFGFGAPLSGGLVDRFGPRRIMVGGLCLVAIGLGPLLLLRDLWQLHLFWGLVTGIGTGAIANVLGATVALRWFRTNRGVVLGLFAAASSMGQLVFLPTLVAITTAAGWRGAIALLFGAIGVLIVPALVLMRNRPEDVGARPVGDPGESADEQARAEAAAELAEDARRTPMREAVRTWDFWLLAGSFFVCGYTSNGLIGTHLIPHAVEHGFTELTAASAVGLMGMMNVVGTLASGWLTDRYDNRRLLAAYYAFRALAIFCLPFILEIPGLLIFAVVYGLDWIATVPPTANLTAMRFGRASVGTIYGWIFCSHMVGAALAAFLGGWFRDQLGDYTVVFMSAAALGFIAAALSLRISLSGVTPGRVEVRLAA